MKYLLNNNDIEGAKYGRILLNENKILLKDFDANGYDYVDLGLPSGTLWATCNVGASTPEDSGLYFAWGDVQGYTAEQVGTGEGKKAFTWADYKYSKGYIDHRTSNLIKYCNNALQGYNGFIDNKIVLDLEDDAARVNMGGKWRMPSQKDLMELTNNTVYETATINNRDGIRFIHKTNPSISIFIPLAGAIIEGELVNIIDFEGNLWSNELNEPLQAYALGFTNDYPENAYYFRRCAGFSVRGVLKRK